MKVQNTMSSFPAWGPDRGTGNPQGIWPWRQVEFDFHFHKTSIGLRKQTPVFEGTDKALHAPRLRGRSSDSTGNWTKATSQCRRVFWGGVGWQGLRNWGVGNSSLGRSPLALILLEVTINPTIKPTDPRAGSSQAKKLPGESATPSTSRLKLYWAWPCPPEQDSVFSHHQSFPSGSLHKPVSLFHQRADRRSKKNHNPTVTKTKTTLQKANQDEKA